MQLSKMKCSCCTTEYLLHADHELPIVLNGGEYVLCRPCTQLKITPASFTKDQKFDGVFAEEEKEDPNNLDMPPMPAIPKYYWENDKQMWHAPPHIVREIINQSLNDTSTSRNAETYLSRLINQYTGQPIDLPSMQTQMNIHRLFTIELLKKRNQQQTQKKKTQKIHQS
jgi:hypothetical protein